MSDTILALLGFATVIAVIVLLLRNVTVPALAFVSVSTITAAILVATGAFTLDEMAGFIKEGVKGAILPENMFDDLMGVLLIEFTHGKQVNFVIRVKTYLSDKCCFFWVRVIAVNGYSRFKIV